MTKRYLQIAVVALLLAIPAMAQEKQIDTEKAENIQHLLKLIGAEKVQKGLVDQVIAIMKPVISKGANGDDKAQKVINRFSELLAEEYDKLNFLSISADLYDKYFTSDEIKGLIAFYETPVGQKTIEVLPTVTQEGMRRGIELAQAAMPNVLVKLLNEFPDLKDALKQQ